MEPWRRLDAADAGEAAELLRACCGSERWVERMIARRPFGDQASLMAAAREVWFALDQDDWREAFAHHPKIGDRGTPDKRFAATRHLSDREQQGVGGPAATSLTALADGNRRLRADVRLHLHRLRDWKDRGRDAGSAAGASGQRSGNRDPRCRIGAGRDHGAAIERDCVRGGWRCSRPAVRVTGLGAFMPGAGARYWRSKICMFLTVCPFALTPLAAIVSVLPSADRLRPFTTVRLPPFL